MRNPKSKRTQKTQMLKGMPKSKAKVIVKTKWGCPAKTIKKKNKSKKTGKKKGLKDIMSQVSDSDPESLKPWHTFWALWIPFFHSQEL